MTYFDHKTLWILIAVMVFIPVSVGFVLAVLKSTTKNPFPCHAAKREPVEFGVWVTGDKVSSRNDPCTGQSRENASKAGQGNRKPHTFSLSKNTTHGARRCIRCFARMCHDWVMSLRNATKQNRPQFGVGGGQGTKAGYSNPYASGANAYGDKASVGSPGRIGECQNPTRSAHTLTLTLHREIAERSQKR